jgi:hypothetical protein
MEMKYTNNEIPGLINPDTDLPAFKFFASQMPDNCKILELGSMVGKSAVAWADLLDEQNKNHHIYCVDTFQFAPYEFMRRLEDEYGITVDNLNNLDHNITQLDAFKLYTAGHNITPIHSDCNIFVPLEKFHCIFEDSDHTYDTLIKCLPKWWDSILPSGILCGHDYNQSCPGVIAASNEFASLVGKPLHIYPNSEIWYILKD